MAKRKRVNGQAPPWANVLRRLEQLQANLPAKDVMRQPSIPGLRREKRSLILHPVLMRELEIHAARNNPPVTPQRFIAIMLAERWRYEKTDV